MLEAKDKDQEHKRKCSPKSQKFFRRSQQKKKKKRLHKNFLGDFQKKKKKEFFKRSPQKIVSQKIFQALHIMLSSSRGQANFRGLEASRPRPRT